MVIGNTTRTHSSKVYPFDELYGISYNLELTKEDLSNMPLNFEKMKVKVYLWVVYMGTNLETSTRSY